MNQQRIETMTERVAEQITEEFSPIEMNNRVAAVAPDEDDALANIDMALDTVLAAFKVIDENLSRVKVEGVPEKAARDAIRDLMDTAISPYFADILKAMQIFGS
jgi:hypothetical protein